MKIDSINIMGWAMAFPILCPFPCNRTVRVISPGQTRSGYMMTSPTFAKWRPRRETRGKVTSRLFAAPRSAFIPHTTLRAVTLDNGKSGV